METANLGVEAPVGEQVREVHGERAESEKLERKHQPGQRFPVLDGIGERVEHQEQRQSRYGQGDACVTG
jgi:UTP:GlnB (protein PII) uridylyltransferase